MPWSMLRSPVAVAFGGVLAVSGCAKQAIDESRVTQGENTFGQASRYVQKAVRRSPEGFILMPSRTAERAFDRLRLNELAQDLRAPAAICFVNRTIETARRGEIDGEATYVDVPEGQARIRVRIAPDGQVLRTDVLETAFEDEVLEECLMEVLRRAPWPENRTGNAHWIDVIHWVSLGFQAEDRSAETQAALRREQALAAVKGKECLRNRVRPGTYRVEGLSLVDREGRTLVNRLEPSDLPQEVADCLVYLFREIRMPRVGDAFVRPFSPEAEFTVTPGGEVSFKDERWLTLILLEEEAEREARRAELLREDPTAVAPPKVEDEVARGLVDRGPDAEDIDGSRASDPSLPPPKKPAPKAKGEGKRDEVTEPEGSGPRADPGQGGLRLDLGTRPTGR